MATWRPLGCLVQLGRLALSPRLLGLGPWAPALSFLGPWGLGAWAVDGWWASGDALISPRARAQGAKAKKNNTCAWTPNQFFPFLIVRVLGAWLDKSRQVGGDRRRRGKS